MIYCINTNTQAKTTGRVAAVTGVVIATVTLTLVTAALASMMPVQIAHASCITSPNGKGEACSGSAACEGLPNGHEGNTCSETSTGQGAVSGPSGGESFAIKVDSASGAAGHCATSNGHTVCSGH